MEDNYEKCCKCGKALTGIVLVWQGEFYCNAKEATLALMSSHRLTNILKARGYSYDEINAMCTWDNNKLYRVVEELINDESEEINIDELRG